MDEKKMSERALELAAEGVLRTVEWHKRLAEGHPVVLMSTKPLLDDAKRGCESPLGGRRW